MNNYEELLSVKVMGRPPFYFLNRDGKLSAQPLARRRWKERSGITANAENKTQLRWRQYSAMRIGVKVFPA